MRRALTWLAGAVGLAALARLRSRRHAGPVPAGLAVEEDPAEELRRKLAEQRDDETEESDPEVAAADLVDLEARRARVHARAQEAIELMSDGGETPTEPDDDSVA